MSDSDPTIDLTDSAAARLPGSERVPQTEIVVRQDGVELARATLPPGEYTIGRAPDAHVRAEAPMLSGRHALLTINFDHCLIEDLGSSNGTFVAEQRIAECTRLFPSQQIRLGPDVTVEIHRQRPAAASDLSLGPAQSAIRQLVPEEVHAGRRYAVGAMVARGGMGAILDARQTAIERRVAMKVMLENVDAADVARFVDEAKITGQLEHPNIVPVHELGVDDNGQLFYTMKLVRGITLKKVLELLGRGVGATAEKYPLPALLTIFQKACDAIAFAHSKGVIHRDLKPENIMLGDFGEVLVMDWGLAKVLGQRSTLNVQRSTCDEAEQSGIASARGSDPKLGSTMAGTVMGTPGYMAPEQARGEVETMDARADIYALGAILFEMLHLRPTITGMDAWDVVHKTARGEIAWESSKSAIANRQSAIPDSLLAVCRKALALDRAQRYARVEDLQADIAAYQGGFATSAEKAGAWKQFTLFVKRHKAASLGVAAVLLVGGVLGTKAIVEGRRAERALADLKASAPGLLKLAESEAEALRFAEALRDLDSALALDPALTRARWRRVWVLLALEKWRDAADALRRAQQHDPAEHAHDAMRPVLDALAAAPDEATRFTPGRATELFQHLTQAGASGEVIALSKRLMLGAADKQRLVRQRLDSWLGKGVGTVTVLPNGGLEVDKLPTTVSSLEPLHGLPIDSLIAMRTSITSLEPLRGMALIKINLGETKVSDLSPLRGMPLEDAYFFMAKGVSDLSPLKGMPLKSLIAGFTQVSDVSPLAGAPIEHIFVGGVADLSPLRGAPLRIVEIGNCKCSDLSFLATAPVEVLKGGVNQISDLSPLRGRPLRELQIGTNLVRDLSPLAGLPVETLDIAENPLQDYAPLLELSQLRKLTISNQRNAKVSIEPLRQHPTLQLIESRGFTPMLPVAEFWQRYDAMKAGK